MTGSAASVIRILTLAPRRRLAGAILGALVLSGCAGPQTQPGQDQQAAVPPMPMSSLDTAPCCELEPPAAHHLRFLDEQEVRSRYRFRLETDPPRPVAGEQALFSVHVESLGAGAGGGLGLHRERRIHLTVVSENREEVYHVHPEEVEGWREMSILEGRLAVSLTLGQGGSYRVFADFVEDGMGVQTAFPLRVGGPSQEPTQRDESRERVRAALEISLVTAEQVLAEGREVNGVFRLEKEGRPVADLEPFGGALAHILMFSEGPEGSFQHLHGGGQEYSHFAKREVVEGYRGPKLYWSALLGRTGNYRTFLLLRRNGGTTAVPFDFVVKSPTQVSGS